MEVGLITAFLGGFLALLSPCGAMLLPAFFASTVGATTRLLGHAAVFYVGLLLALAPLGFAAGAIGSFLAEHRATVVTVTSVLLIVLGLMQAFGRGFDLARIVPTARQLPERAAKRRGVGRTFALGAASGLVGMCTGPILGAVLTLAAAQGDTAGAVLLLAVYGSGMVVPLVVLAACWERLGAHGHGVLRGRSFNFLGRQWHTTSLVTGVLLVTVGTAFWLTNGFVGVPELIPVDVQMRLQAFASDFFGTGLDVIVIVAIVVVTIVIWVLRHRGSKQSTDTREEHNQAPSGDR